MNVLFYLFNQISNSAMGFVLRDLCLNFEIKSNTQIRTDELFIAEGDVVIQNGSSILVGEKLEYNY